MSSKEKVFQIYNDFSKKDGLKSSHLRVILYELKRPGSNQEAFFGFLLSVDTMKIFRIYHDKGAPQGFFPFAIKNLSEQEPTLEHIEECLEVYLEYDKIRNILKDVLYEENGDVDSSRMVKSVSLILEECARNPNDFRKVKVLLDILPCSIPVKLLLNFFQLLHKNPPLEEGVASQCLELFSKDRLSGLLSSGASLSKCSMNLSRCLDPQVMFSDTETTPPANKEATKSSRGLLGKTVNTVSNGAGKAARSVTRLVGNFSRVRLPVKRR